MTRDECIKKLSYYLRKLPKVERQEAISYYREYFQEAGEENESRVIEELGSPQELAKKITIDCVEKQFEEETKDAKQGKSLSKVWIVLLAICALPVSPVILSVVIVIFVLMGVILLTIGVMIFTGAVVAIAGIPTTLMGIILLFSHLGNGMILTGNGMVIMAVGGLLFVGSIQLWYVAIKGIVYMGRSLICKKNPSYSTVGKEV
jgi:uncharacterized membrane protein